MAKLASKMIELAESWVGIKEGSTGHKEILAIYNSQKPLPRGYKMTTKDAWCAATTTALAVKLGYTDIIPCECSCNRIIAIAKDMGIWVENENVTPQVGWLAIYDWEDSGSGDNKNEADHIGIVNTVGKTTFTVIEGNADTNRDGKDGVEIRTVAINGRYLRGFVAPKYDAEEAKPTTPSNVDIDALAKDVIAGKYGTGAVRKANLGDLYDAVQARVNEMLSPKVVHTVVKGDTLWGIAKKYLGDGGRYPEIVKLNGLKTTTLRVGQKLTIPNK